MAYFFRLVAFVLLGFCATAASAYTAPTVYTVNIYGIIGSGSSAAAACNSAGDQMKAAGWSSFAYPSSNEFCGSSNGAAYPLSSSASCGANSLLQGSQCVCNTGFTDTGSSCENASQAAKCSAAKGGSDWFTGTAGVGKKPLAFGTSYCPTDGAASSCGSLVTGGYCATKNGSTTCSWEVKYTGAPCTPPASPSETATNDPCKGSSGTVNGKVVCLPIGTDPATTTETTKTTTTTSTTGGGVDGNSPTSSGTSSSTQCTGSQCTTTTTTTTSTTNADGTTSTKTATGTKTEPKEDYCTSNPKAIECGGSSFGGSCSASFTCEGDAVMCAIAKDQHIRNCTLFDKETPEGALFNTEKNKEGSQVTNEDKSISSASFDTSNALGGGSGSCIADKSITVMGWTGSIPFSSVCPHLAVFGNILLVVSFLLAGRIVARG